jgi:hypothetical protein
MVTLPTDVLLYLSQFLRDDPSTYLSLSLISKSAYERLQSQIARAFHRKRFANALDSLSLPITLMSVAWVLDKEEWRDGTDNRVMYAIHSVNTLQIPHYDKLMSRVWNTWRSNDNSYYKTLKRSP